MSTPMSSLGLTAADVQTFKTWLTANAAGLTDDQARDLANTAGAYLVWRTDCPKSGVRAALTLANYTPADPVPNNGTTTTVTNNQLFYQNAAMVCQLKQSNVIFLVSGNDSLDFSNSTLRQSMSDCMSAIPAGASQANVNAGWSSGTNPGAVRLVGQRGCTNAEKLFVITASGAGNDGVSGNRGTATNPDNLKYEGLVTSEQVAEARAS